MMTWHPLGFLSQRATDVVAVRIRIMNHEQLIITSLFGMSKQRPAGFAGVAFTGHNRHIMTLGKPGGLEDRPEPLFLDVEDLVVQPGGVLVISDFTCTQWDRLAGMGFVKNPAWLVVKPI